VRHGNGDFGGDTEDVTWLRGYSRTARAVLTTSTLYLAAPSISTSTSATSSHNNMSFLDFRVWLVVKASKKGSDVITRCSMVVEPRKKPSERSGLAVM